MVWPLLSQRRTRPCRTTAFNVEITIDRNPLMRFVGWCIAILASAHIFVQLIGPKIGHTNASLVEVTNLDHEKSIGTLFNVGLWLLITILLVSIARSQSKTGTRMQWYGLATLFGFLTIDEFSSVHEKLSKFLHGSMQTSGVFVYAWIVPYVILLTILLASYWRFFASIPTNVRKQFFQAGLVFCSGAIGIEMFEGSYAATHGTDLLYYVGFVAPEETLEMIGLAMFISALLKLISHQSGIRASQGIELNESVG